MATIIGHRGYWIAPGERNTRRAFERCFASGFGIETDIRDDGGRLVVSHDPPSGDELTLDELLAMYASHDYPGSLAINVKADGLHDLLIETMETHAVDDWFPFDMSTPECVVFSKRGTGFFTRLSEYERDPILYDNCEGVWVDSFESEWFDDGVLIEHLEAGKRVAVVSPELHGREPHDAWRKWALWSAFASDRTVVCTDHPEKVRDLLPA